MKGPSRKEEIVKIKPKTPLSFDEAKASCKARKRKERQESISSLYQERKVIRSNSEERPTLKKIFDKDVIRRVSSNEDFQKSDRKSHFDRNTSPANDILLIFDEEYEKRRCHERFSKPFAVKKKSHKSRKTKVKLLAKPREELLHLEIEKKERTPSPVQFPPDIDLSKLHEQVDCSEPLLSCANHEINEDTETLPGLSVASNRLLSSPRNSIIATHRIYLDPDVQQIGVEGKTASPLQSRSQKISKQINGIKKKIKKYETDFESKHGYKVSHADKLNEKTIRKLYLELTKLKKEQKQLVDVCPQKVEETDDGKSGKNLVETLKDIDKKLVQKRENCNRSDLLEKMSQEELLEEKVAVQKALLYLESIHGRPDNKEDRDLARPIYDRYRMLKRMITKTPSNLNGNELATIHEDETMNFITSFPTTTSDLDSEKSPVFASTDSSDTDTSFSETLHSLTKFELIEQHKVVSEEKKELRRTIKMFELDVQHKTGRMVQKEDKIPMEHIYVAYKKVKAKLKLLDALVGKQV